MVRLKKRDSDGVTQDLDLAEAEIYNSTALARRHILVNSSGTEYDSSNPLPVDTEISLAGDVIVEKVKIEDASAGTQTNDLKVTMDGELVDIDTVNTVSEVTTITNNVTVDQSSTARTVTSTDLDIRDLAHTQDSIKVGDGTDFIDIETLSDDDHDIDGLKGLTCASALYGRIDADTIKPLRIDSATHAMEIIDYAHHEVHAGSHYYIEGYTTLANAGTLYVKLVTPDTEKWSHFTWQIASSGILTTTLVEAPTGGATGETGVTIFNSDRNSLNTSGLTITSGVTAPTGGTIISQTSWGSRTIGGGQSRDDELILKQDTTYCRTFTSGAASNIVNFRASWYEHTNK